MESTPADLANILSMTNAFANNQQQSNSVLEKSTLNASTNSNNSTNGLSSILNRNQFNNNQQFQSSNSISIAGTGQQSNGNFMPSSVPTHFSFADQLASLSGLRSQASSGLGSFNVRRENSPPMLNNNNLGPIARPRSYSSSHTSNLHHSNLNRENFLNSFFKNQSIEEKAAVVNGLVQQQQQQNILPLRKVSTPSTLFAAATGSKTDSPTSLFSNQSQFNAALQSNLVNSNGSSNNLGSGIPSSATNQFFHNLDSTNTTVESVVHSLALDDLTLDDLEESLEKELLNRANMINSSLQEESRNLQQQSNNNSVNAASTLVRSSSNLVNTNSSGTGK